MNLVFLGAPGAGKGTQAAHFARRYGLAHLATGDMLRSAGDRLDEKLRALMNRGAILPDEVVTDLIAERLDDPDCAGGVILDGFPRTIGQAEMLEARLKGKNPTRRIDAVIMVECDLDALFQRITERASQAGGSVRADDAEEVFRHRLEVYKRQTRPLVSYYQKKGLLEKLDGMASIAEVSAAIESILRSRVLLTDEAQSV